MTDGSKVRIEHDPSRAGRPASAARLWPSHGVWHLTPGPAPTAGGLDTCPGGWSGVFGEEQEGPTQHTLEMREGHFAWRCRPWTNEPCKAPHRDRGGPAGEAATPPPSSSPAGGVGPVNPGNAARGGNRTSLKPLEFTSSAGSEKDGSPRFRSVQSRKLSIIAKRFHLLYADSRLADLRVFGDARCPTQEYVSSADSRSVTMEMVEPLSVTSFSLCMRRLYDELKSAHHLRHGGRMQLGLFLKKIGLSLNESLKFWEYHFRPKIDAEKFQRQYAYSIRHNYGEEGKRADYAAYSCLKIIMNNPPGIGDFHGCPFKHCDAEHLQQLLKNCGIHKDDIKNIVNYASNNHYNKACSIFFDCMHKLPEGGLGEFITHPNQYFDESRKLYSRSSSKKRFPILHAM
ncbi:DNA primase large subunit [Trichinella spiralis]|uniref:DNA primase large subunit n=1 Tax=Trichinella spiralis TaxID=6334 RepID=A0ABR3K5P0_TRISP